MKSFTDNHKCIRVINVRTGKSGVAKCRESDSFNKEIGVAVAYARYKGAKIPVEIKPLTQYESSEVAAIMKELNISDVESLKSILYHLQGFVSYATNDVDMDVNKDVLDLVGLARKMFNPDCK